MKKTVLLLTSVFVLMLGLVGCSSSDKGSDVNVEMRTVTDVKGEVEIPVNPKRIVDISGASDILSILGPPGYPSPIALATLSKASPAASSLVSPIISNSP